MSPNCPVSCIFYRQSCRRSLIILPVSRSILYVITLSLNSWFFPFTWFTQPSLLYFYLFLPIALPALFKSSGLATFLLPRSKNEGSLVSQLDHPPNLKIDVFNLDRNHRIDIFQTQTEFSLVFCSSSRNLIPANGIIIHSHPQVVTLTDILPLFSGNKRPVHLKSHGLSLKDVFCIWQALASPTATMRVDYTDLPLHTNTFY